jgi:signal transduction protein with GAF and PtsI domain
MHPNSPLLPDPELEELGERLVRALERYAKRLRRGEFLSLIDSPTESVFRNLRLGVACDSCGLWIADEARENLVFAITEPEDERVVGREQPLSEGFISLVFASERPICENRVADDERHSKRIDGVVGETTEAMVAVPFYLAGILCGVLSAVRWKGGCASGKPFDQTDLKAMQRVSVVLERLANLSLAKSVLGIDL